MSKNQIQLFRENLERMESQDKDCLKLLSIASKIPEDKINQFINGKDNLNQKEINLLNLLK